MNFENTIDLDIEATISIDKLFLAGEENSFTREIIIPKSGGAGQISNYTEIIDLDGATLGNGTTALKILHVDIEGFTIDTGDNYRDINSTDYFNVISVINELKFAFIEGILMPAEQDPIENEEIIDTNYPYIEGDFSISGHSEIRLKIDTPMPTSMTLQVIVYNKDDESVSLVDSTNVPPTLDIPAGSSSITLSSEKYNVNELVSILPNRIVYIIEPIIGDEEQTFIYHEGDTINSEITIEALLDITADCWLIPRNENGDPDIQAVETSNIEQEQIDSFINGKITFDYQNTIGFSAGIDLLISNSKAENFANLINPDSTQYTIIKIPPLEETTDTEMKQIEVQLKQSDLQLMLADSIYVIPKLRISSEENTPISGGLEMIGLMEIEIKISNNLADGNE